MEKDTQMKPTAIYPSFEIKAKCSCCGNENSLFAYNSHFFSRLESFAEKYNLNKKTLENLSQKHLPEISTLPLCCQCKIKFGQVFSISAKSENRINVNKNPVSALPGPLSDGETLSWV